MKRVDEKMFGEIRLKMVMRLFGLTQRLADRLIRQRQSQHEIVAQRREVMRKLCNAARRHTSKEKTVGLV